MYKKLLVEMVEAYLNKGKLLRKGEKITDSMEAEPENERIEIYISSKRYSMTVLAITMTTDIKIIEIYPEFFSDLKIPFSELFKFLGFTIMERKPV